MDKPVNFINRCIISGIFSNRLKIAVVKPIYKNGDKALMTNYRPISMLTDISKIMENIMHERVMDHLENNNTPSSDQLGF